LGLGVWTLLLQVKWPMRISQLLRKKLQAEARAEKKDSCLHTCPIHPSFQYASKQRVRNRFSFLKKPQGPSSPVDNNLELKLEFLSNMVTEMQEKVAKKTQRMVIERTIEGRLMIKALNDYLKLHLPTSFISATLLTCGFFEALFRTKKEPKRPEKSP
jgi:hypothetical protein